MREPAGELLGTERLEADPERGFARLGFTARPEFCNAMGMLQGGFVCAMLDQAMSEAGFAHLGWAAFLPTLEVKVNFLRAAGLGRLFGEGRVVRATRNVMFLEGRLYDADGNLLATATQTAVIRRNEDASQGGPA